MIGCFDLMRRLVSASSQALASFPKVFNVDVSISGTTFWHETWIAHQKFRMILENYQALLWWISQTGSFLSKVLKQSTLNQLQEQLQELDFQQRYHIFLSAFLLGCLLWETGNQRLKYKLVDKKWRLYHCGEKRRATSTSFHLLPWC